MSRTRIYIIAVCIILGMMLLSGLDPQLPDVPAGSEAEKVVKEVRRKAPDVTVPSPAFLANEKIRQGGLAKKQIKQMKTRLKERQLREESGMQTRDRWELMGRRNDWKLRQLIETNQAIFKEMLILARKEADREIRCLLCDGKAELDLCFICDRKGLCPSCGGSGRERYETEKPCITCEGRTSCFLCAGRKKLECPFCEKGRVSTVTPWPSFKLELP